MSRSTNPRLAAALGTLACLSLTGARWAAIEKIPDHPAVVVRVNEKPRSYHRLTPDAPLTFEVEGPGRLRIVSRALLPPRAGAVVSYRLTLSEGQTRLKEHRTESSPAPSVEVVGEEAAVGKSRTMRVSIPGGRHRLTLQEAGAAAVLVRLLYDASGRRADAMISLTPYEASRSVTVSEDERLIPYYSVLPGKPVRLKIVGPTRLELTCRLDFDATMRGVQPYRLKIRQDGGTARDVALKTTKATTATYVDLKDRVASKLDRVVIPIGDGTHDISIELTEPKQGSAEIHARIPQPDVGREE
jgi:hypothetical protein